MWREPVFEERCFELEGEKGVEFFAEPVYGEADKLFIAFGDDGSHHFELSIEDADKVRDVLLSWVAFETADVDCPFCVERVMRSGPSHDAHLCGCSICESGSVPRHVAREIQALIDEGGPDE